MAYVQDFEGYSLGEINGVDGWTSAGGNGKYSIVSSPVESGTRGVKGTAPSNYLYRSIAAASSGSQGLWARTTNNTVELDIMLGATTFTSSWMFINVGDTPGSWKFIYSGGQDVLGTAANDTWYKIEYEWHSSPAREMRVRLNGGTWTAFRAAMGTGDAQFLTQYCTADSYFDDFFDPNAPPVTASAGASGRDFMLTGAF